MKPWLNLTMFTFHEVIQGRVYRILLAASLLTPLLCLMLSSLFLVDVGKVYMDAVIGLTHAVLMVYILFVSVSLLANDVEQKVCYLLLAHPASRRSYVCGRFFGLLLGMLVLLCGIVLVNALAGQWYMESLMPVYRSHFSWLYLLEVVFLHSFQYIALLGVIFFIFSWATGAAEIMLFSSAVLFFSWVFPPILLAMQRQDVAKDVPVFIQQLLDFIYQLLPHLNGGLIALTLAHGKSLPWIDVTIYVAEHLSYAAVMLMLALWMFSKRDL